MYLLLRVAGVARSGLGLMGRYRSARILGFAIAIGFVIFAIAGRADAADGGNFLVDPDAFGPVGTIATDEPRPDYRAAVGIVATVLGAILRITMLLGLAALILGAVIVGVTHLRRRRSLHRAARHNRIGVERLADWDRARARDHAPADGAARDRIVAP